MSGADLLSLKQMQEDARIDQGLELPENIHIGRKDGVEVRKNEESDGDGDETLPKIGVQELLAKSKKVLQNTQLNSCESKV